MTQTVANGVLISRLKTMLRSTNAKHEEWEPQPALKVCVTMGLTRKEIERAGTTIRHAITKVVTRRRT
jgi:serine palmitoyltransferase